MTDQGRAMEQAGILKQIAGAIAWPDAGERTAFLDRIDAAFDPEGFEARQQAEADARPPEARTADQERIAELERQLADARQAEVTEDAVTVATPETTGNVIAPTPSETAPPVAPAPATGTGETGVTGAQG